VIGTHFAKKIYQKEETADQTTMVEYLSAKNKSNGQNVEGVL
jgi:hypothetical protein